MVTKPSMPNKKEFFKYINEIWDNQWLTNNGPLLQKFEIEMKNYLNCPNICFTTNGHSSLEIAIKGLGITGEVITTPFTFASTVHAITLNNLTPVFCDIKKSDLTIDESKIEDLITDKTTAIIPVHVYGHTCNIEAIKKIADKHNLKVIYDAAHAFGVQKNGTSIASYGDASIFSFHATKIFNTVEGGAIIYKDKKYTRLFNAYRNFGIEGEEQIDFIGGNHKMNEIQAAMGLANMKNFSKVLEKRKKLTLHYRKLLSNIPGIKFFEPETMSDYTYNYSYFPILIDENIFGINRDYLYNNLKEYNIFARKYFYPLVCDFGCYKKIYNNVELPVAREISEKILCLPLYADLKKEDIDYICNCIKKCSSIHA